MSRPFPAFRTLHTYPPTNVDATLTRAPHLPPGCRIPSDPPATGIREEAEAWDRLTDRQRDRIETAFIDNHFERDFLGDVLDAVTDAKRIALLRKIQGLWLTHRAVELGLP